MKLIIFAFTLFMATSVNAEQWRLVYFEDDISTKPTKNQLLIFVLNKNQLYASLDECEAAKALEGARGIPVFCQVYTPPKPAWKFSQTIDEFTEQRTLSAFALGSTRDHWGNRDYHSLGIECRNKSDLSLTFSTNIIATPSSNNITLYIKIDQNKAVKLSARMYRNSYESGYVTINKTNSLFDQLKAGNRARVRIDAGNEIIDWSVSLKGFTQSSAKVLNDCQ